MSPPRDFEAESSETSSKTIDDEVVAAATAPLPSEVDDFAIAGQEIRVLITYLVLRQHVTIGSNNTVEQLFALISKTTHVPMGCFTLTADDMELTESEFPFFIADISNGKTKLDLFIERTDGGTEIVAAESATATATGTGTDEEKYSDNYDNWTLPSGVPTVGFKPQDYVYKSRRTDKFRGLSNQGATCYMNSLLQSLYMTPEFRSALFSWRLTNPEKRAKSIPFQLQKLFAGLQLTTTKMTLQTKNLTSSFGWESGEAFEQHDVQELCLVLFQSLEKTFRKTPFANLIQDMFQGTVEDYVECKECGQRSSRPATFRDIQLQLREFGSTETRFSSIEEALMASVEPFVLDGDNQYLCEKCGKKVDALKGQTYSRLPYVLMLTLSRFDMNWETGARYKIHDRVSFPKFLETSQLLQHHSKNNSGGEGAAAPVAAPPAAAAEASESEKSASEATNETQENPHSSSNLTRSSSSSSSPLYELYSVMVHSGGAYGGHYYAYIKCFADNKWYEFNDSLVAEISDEELESAFGGPNSSSSAYMLLYRRVDSSRNLIDVSSDGIDPELQGLLEEEAAQQEQITTQQRNDWFNRNFSFMFRNKEVPLSFNENNPVSEFIPALREALKISESEIADRNLRVRRYAPYQDMMREIVDVFAEENADKSVRAVFPRYELSFAVETKNDDEVWSVYNENDMCTKTSFLLADGSISEPMDVFVDRRAALSVLRLKLTTFFAENPELAAKFWREEKEEEREFEIYKGNAVDPRVELLTSEGEDLYSLCVFDGSLLFVVPKNIPAELSSSLFGLVEQASSRVKISFTNLNESEYLHSMFVSCFDTLGSLKDKIASILSEEAKKKSKEEGEEKSGDLDPSTFRLYKARRVEDIELTKLNSSLKENGIVAYGTQLNREKLLVKSPVATERKVTLVLLQPDIADTVRGEEPEVMKIIGEMVLDTTGVMVGDLKKQILAHLISIEAIPPESQHLRLRSMDNYRGVPLQILFDEEALSQRDSYFEDGKFFGVQVIDKPECRTNDDQLVIEVQRWYPSKFELGSRVEVMVEKSMEVKELRSILSSKMDIPIDNLRAARCLSYTNMPLQLVEKLKWTDFLSEESWAVATVWHTSTIDIIDGAVIFVKDASEQTLVLSEERKSDLDEYDKLIRKNFQAKASSAVGSISSLFQGRRGEVGVVIRNDDDDEEEEKKKPEEAPAQPAVGSLEDVD